MSPLHRWTASLVVLLIAGVASAACGRPETGAEEGAAAPAASDAARSARLPSADDLDVCAFVTEDDVRRISGYADTAIRRGTNGNSCLRQTADERFGVIVTRGRYVDLRPSLGGRHIDLGNGLRGYENGSGWVNTVIYPDGSSVNVGISGRAMSNESPKAGYRLQLADGAVVDVASQYRAYADSIASRTR